jgi:hypothetical protein
VQSFEPQARHHHLHHKKRESARENERENASSKKPGTPQKHVHVPTSARTEGGLSVMCEGLRGEGQRDHADPTDRPESGLLLRLVLVDPLRSPPPPAYV